MDQATGKDEDASLVIDTLFKVIYIFTDLIQRKAMMSFLMELDFYTRCKELENISNVIGELFRSKITQSR